MNNRNIIAATFATLFLSACSSVLHQDNNKTIHHKDTNAFNILIDQISENIQDIWGSKEVLIAGPRDYVKYSIDQRTRVHINFVSGIITIETLENQAKMALRPAIVSTLLLPEPIDILNNKVDKDSTRPPFLYKQVIDETGHPVRWEWRANRFADYLLAKNIKTRSTKNKKISYININLVPNHTDERAQKFLPMVKAAANHYQLDEALILAIIKTESNYNPYATSRSDALGLMQVQRHTAGRDLYHMWGKRGEPSKSFLLDPTNNIRMGSAYLALIRDRYLAGIKHSLSMKHAMIAAYNGGAGNVLMTFSKDRKKAIDIINSLTPSQVYHKLVSSHSSLESRQYLIKISNMLSS